MKKNFIILASAKIFYGLSQWLLLVIVAQIGGESALGEFSLALAITTPIFLFSSLQLPSLIIADSQKNLPSDYIKLNQIMVLASVLLLIILTIASKYNLNTSVIIVLYGLVKATESISEIQIAFLHKAELFRKMALSLVIKSIGITVLFFSTYLLTESLASSILSIILVRFSIYIFFDRKESLKLLDNKKNIHGGNNTLDLFNKSIYLGIIAAMDSLLTITPRYFIEYFHTRELLGGFTAISSIALIPTTLSLVFIQIISPKLSKIYKESQTIFIKLVYKYILILMILALTFNLLINLNSELIIKLLFNINSVEYATTLEIFSICLIFGFPATFLNTVLIIKNKFKHQILYTFIVLIVTLLASSILIPSLGIIGAAYVSIITWLTMMIVNTYIFLKNSVITK